MKLHRSFRAALAALLLCAVLCFGSFAAAAAGIPAELLSPEGVGSITVKVVTSSGEIIPDGTLRAYFVASLSAQGYFSLTPDFAGCGLDLTQREFTEDDVAPVSGFASSNAVPYAVAAVDDAGQAVFGELKQGIYLIAQDLAPQAYLPILPFFVLVPTFTDGAAEYNVTCSPKPVDRAPDLTVPFTAEKDVLCKSGVTPPADTPFSFVLTPEQVGQPMPKSAENAPSAVTGALTVTRKGAGTVDFGSFAFTKADAGKTYVYRLRELKGSALHYTYDATVFTVSLHLSLDEKGNLVCRRIVTDEGGKLYDEIIFSNEYDQGPPDIPRTGQLWWPVFALAGAGALLTIAGLWRRKRGEAQA